MYSKPFRMLLTFLVWRLAAHWLRPPTVPIGCIALTSCARFQSPLASHHKPARASANSGWRLGCGERLVEVVHGHLLI